MENSGREAKEHDRADGDRDWEPRSLPNELEFGDAVGDARENDPRAAGFTPGDDRLFRSHFQHANRMADRSYEQVRPAYRLGREAADDPRYAERSFSDVEAELRNGWLTVRTGTGDWSSVREYVREGFERAHHIGAVDDNSRLGGSASHQRASYSDPVAGDSDPTSPDSPEQQIPYESRDSTGFPEPLGGQGGFGEKGFRREKSS